MTYFLPYHYITVKNYSFDIIIPTYNEEKIIQDSLHKLIDFHKNAAKLYNINCSIIIVDNGSTDQTSNIVKKFLKLNPEVKLIEISDKGKGIAVRTGFLYSKAEFVVFSDADLASDIMAIPRMLELANNGADLVYASRFENDSEVSRSITRAIPSYIFLKLANIFLSLNISDYNCGLKLYNRKVFLDIFLTLDNYGFFFDTEVIYRASLKKINLKPVGVRWVEGEDSKVKVFNLSLNYLRNLINIKKKRRTYLSSSLN